jgi:hypothetical protein
MEIPDTVGFLLGTWDVDRSIADHRSLVSGSFRGTAVVAAEPRPGPGGGSRARYEETGELRFGSHAGPASRRLEYAAARDGGAVSVRFADGRPFVDLDLGGGRWQAVHQCGADRYELTTVVRSHDVVEERWRVRGPAKDYDAVTTLTRRPAGP